MCAIDLGPYGAIYDYANHDVTLRAKGNTMTLPFDVALKLFKGLVKANREAKQLGWDATKNAPTDWR